MVRLSYMVFFVSNLKELDELERRTVNLRYQIVELLISYHLHELEEKKPPKNIGK